MGNHRLVVDFCLFVFVLWLFFFFKAIGDIMEEIFQISLLREIQILSGLQNIAFMLP